MGGQIGCQDTHCHGLQGTHLTQVEVLGLGLSSPEWQFQSGQFETVKGFGKRLLPSEFSFFSLLCADLGKLQKRLGLGDLSCVGGGGGVDWESSEASELPGCRAPGIFTS